MKLFPELSTKDTTNDGAQKAKGSMGNANPSSSAFHQKPGSDNIVRDELIAIIAAMQETESGGAAYDPSGKFVYPEHDDDCQSEDMSVNIECRSRMLAWSSNMFDYFGVDQSVTSVALYYQDRYLSSDMGKAARVDRSIFRVVSVTSMYMALKLCVPLKWNITAMAFAQLCKGAVSGQDISDTEIKILFALGWNVNPPIPAQYVEQLLDLMFYSAERSLRSTSPTCIGISQEDKVMKPLRALREHLHELVSYQIESCSLHDKRLFQVRASVIATSALLNALDGMNEGLLEGIDSTLFYDVSMDIIMNTVAVCKIASTEELDEIRSVLLSSVVSLPIEGNSSQDAAITSNKYSTVVHTQNYTESVEAISSSPTSAISKLFVTQRKMSGSTTTLTPHNVAKIFAFHYIT